MSSDVGYAFLVKVGAAVIAIPAGPVRQWSDNGANALGSPPRRAPLSPASVLRGFSPRVNGVRIFLLAGEVA